LAEFRELPRNERDIGSQEFWDELYRSRSSVWSGEPNDALVKTASSLEAGTALDVGCGEGADAMWLAKRGWHVTAVDISGVALQRAMDRATRSGEEFTNRIKWVQGDLTESVPADASYDLVCTLFMHLPTAQRNVLFRKLADLVAPGGSLLVVGHHPSDLKTSAKRPQQPDLFYTASEVAALLQPDQWQIVVEAADPRVAKGRDGEDVTVHDAILLAQRVKAAGV
jgi:2-polyprenyl-3-methyl-5-hydroxy-6-metoxy-1,4-benzoquinol methylase